MKSSLCRWCRKSASTLLKPSTDPLDGHQSKRKPQPKASTSETNITKPQEDSGSPRERLRISSEDQIHAWLLLKMTIPGKRTCYRPSGTAHAPGPERCHKQAAEGTEHGRANPTAPGAPASHNASAELHTTLAGIESAEIRAKEAPPPLNCQISMEHTGTHALGLLLMTEPLLMPEETEGIQETPDQQGDKNVDVNFTGNFMMMKKTIACSSTLGRRGIRYYDSPLYTFPTSVMAFGD
ncbi:hypothetical protein H920_01327 [Fukomys damarensis]|uniref:Uncharacterized protein n=1 Tax=Fukomys damarensis TaxID=885580 RepID=A0A091ENP3_FUKDA|nr:hypothetical protein H920_01327 [Fukomys damarensis]